jgi:hypothetical protein
MGKEWRFTPWRMWGIVVVEPSDGFVRASGFKIFYHSFGDLSSLQSSLLA